MPVLRLSGLRRRFGDLVALDGLSFSVASGVVTGFLGPNGAGKTTTMRAIFGLVDLDEGEITLDDQPVDSVRRQRFGYMPEERGLYPTMRILDQVEYFGRLHAMSRRDARHHGAEWLARLGLEGREDAKVDELSHGNQQRVQLACALVHEPDVLILDEPLSGLDPTGIDDIGNIIVERAREGRAVVFSSHQLDLVENLCDVVTIIDHGRVVAHGSVDDLASSGAPRLTVRIEGSRDATWSRGLAGVSLSEVNGSEVRLILEDGVDTDLVLNAARAAGRVTEFSLHRRRLSEVFREALS